MMNNSANFLNQSRGQTQSNLLEDSIMLKATTGQMKHHLLWGFVNITALAVVVYNFLHATTDNSVKGYAIYSGLLFLIVIIIINSGFHIIRYLVKATTLKPLCVTPKQKKYLGLENNFGVINTPSPVATKMEKMSQPIFTASSPMSLSTSNWLFSSITENATNVGRSSFNDSWNANSTGLDQNETSPTSFGSFWKNSSTANVGEVSPVLRRCAYQLAPISLVSAGSNSSSVTMIEETGSGSPVAVCHTDFWRRVKIDHTCLTQWNANIRMWISLTILEPLVAELDHIDAAFVRFGLSDMHLGSVGLDRLKRTASIPQLVAGIPSLPRLVLFLELSQHQEYIVTRIRELAKGGSMSEFRWNNGGSLHGKTWEEHLPTDAALVMHLIATYLDLQLVPAAQRPDGPLARPFSTQHFVRSPEKPPIRPHAPIIYQTQLNPPHFHLVDKDETFDVPKGRNNLLHTFLLFVHLLKTTEYGMLGPLNLGRCGVNVLWVVDS